MDADIECEIGASLEAAIDGLGEDEDIVARLDELGWAEVCDLDAAASNRILFDALGRKHGRVAAIDLLVSDRLRRSNLDVDGTDVRVIVPSPTPVASFPSRQWIAFSAPAASSVALIPHWDADGGVHWWRSQAAQLTFAHAGGWDPSLGWQIVETEAPFAGETVWPTGGEARHAWDITETAVLTALAQLLTSLSRAMVALATVHVTDRIQFGRALGTYQAVQHALAAAYVEVEAADRAVRAAWSDETPLAARVAKALAGRAYAVSAQHAQQVTGAMGMSWEFPLHHYVRRGAVFEATLGSARVHVAELGRQLIMSAASQS